MKYNVFHHVLDDAGRVIVMPWARGVDGVKAIQAVTQCMTDASDVWTPKTNQVVIQPCDETYEIECELIHDPHVTPLRCSTPGCPDKQSHKHSETEGYCCNCA